MTSSSYPASRILRVTNVAGKWQLAYAPDSHSDPLTAYEASLYTIEEDAKADVVEYLDDREDAFKAGYTQDFDRDEEGENEDFVACVVMANGDIEIDAWGLTMTRERIFDDFGMKPGA